MLVEMRLGNVFSEVETHLPQELVNAVTRVCSYEQRTYNAGGGGDIVTPISIYNAHNQQFPTGLSSRIKSVLRAEGCKVRVKDFRERPRIDVDAILRRAEEFSLAPRDYQIEGILDGLEAGGGLFNWCTGAGKTVLFCFLLLAYDEPTLILVNRKELMDQIADELAKITGRSVGKIGDGVWRPSKWTVGIVNTFNKNLAGKSAAKRATTLRYLESVSVFIGDEIHHLGARTWKEVARAAKNARARFGFSGTCFHPDSEDLFLVAYTGEIISTVSSSELIRQGYLAQPRIYMPTIEPKTPLRSGMNWHQTRKLAIRENDAVTESGVRFIRRMYNKGLTMVYFAGDDLAYGQRIYDMCLDAGIDSRDIRYMNGKEPTEVRKKALADFRQKRFRILGGTSIYDEGIDVPHTGAGANFGQGLSEIKTVQRIGRILRKTKPPGAVDVDTDDKQVKYYWDPYNVGNTITKKHAEFRKGIYEAQDAFRVFFREYGSKPRLPGDQYDAG